MKLGAFGRARLPDMIRCGVQGTEKGGEGLRRLGCEMHGFSVTPTEGRFCVELDLNGLDAFQRLFAEVKKMRTGGWIDPHQSKCKSKNERGEENGEGPG